MLDVTVKTLDGTNRSFSVPDDITVKQFKERISGSINITAATQRLIFQGRVLQDDKKLDEYDVNGKVLHVVQRLPPVSTQAPTSSTAGSTTNSTAPGEGGPETRTFVGSFTLPSDTVDPNQIQNVVSQILSGMGDVGRNARISTRSSGDGSSVDIHINLGQIGGAAAHSESQNRIRIVQRMLNMARQTLDKLENPPSLDSEEADPMDSSPSETPSPEPDPSEQPPPSDTNDTTQGAEGGTAEDATPAQGASANGTRAQNRAPPNPPVTALADIFQEIFEVNQRLQPFMQQYQQFLREDPNLENDTERARSSRQLVHNVSQVLHSLSHAYHAVSDLLLDIRQTPPRTLRANPVSPFPTAVIQQTIPVQAQINVAHVSPRGSPQTARRATPSTATTAATSASTTTTRTQPHPQVRLGRPTMPFTMPPGAQIHMAGVPRMAGAAAFGPGGQPLMFMEVGQHGPGGNTTTTPSSQSGSTPSQGPQPTGMPPGGMPANFLPPNFLQNIVQMAQQAAMGAGGQGGQVIVITQGGAMPAPQAASTTAQSGGRSATSTTSATSTQSSTTSGSTQPGSGGVRPRVAAFPFPGPRPGLIPGLPPGAHSVDPFLPCQSRFFLRRRLAAAAATTGTDGMTNNATNTPPDLQGLISNIVSSLPGSGGAGVPPRPSGAAPAGSTAGGVRQGTANTGSQAEPPALVQLQNLLQGAQNLTPPTSNQSQDANSTSSSSQSGGRSGPAAGIGDETFAQMVRGIGSYVSQAATGQQSNDSIYDFINSLGQDSEPAEGLLSDIFACISRHLTIVDLMGILCQQTAPLQRLVGPLQEFVRTRVLQGEEMSEANLDEACDRLVEEMLPQIEEICTDANVRENIDFPASVQELLRLHLRRDSQLIMDARENDPSFGTSLYNNIQRLIHEFLMLSRVCLEGGQQAVHRLVQTNVQRISSDMNPLIQQWMSHMTVQSLQTTLRSTTVSEDSVQQYIVRRAEGATGHTAKRSASQKTSEPPTEGVDRPVSGQDSPQSQSSDASYMSAQSEPRDTVNSTPVLSTEEMEVESAPSPQRGADKDNDYLTCLPPPTRRPADPPVVIGSQDWHSQVPPEWVPIITGDIETQRQQPPQAPFSDAYIGSMPAKRRKIMSKSSSDPELATASAVLPGAIERAARAAGVEPVTSPETMARDAATSTSLRDAYQQQVHSHIRSRLHNDPDYIPQRYPNTDKYYSQADK